MDSHKEISKIISSNIRAERARCGLTQEEVANRLNISARTYIRWEQETNIDCIDLYRLSNVFDCKIEDFFVGLDPTKCDIDIEK